MTPYQFALLRYVHDLVGGEFVNVGAVAFDTERRRLIVRVNSRYGRVSSFFGGIDGRAYRSMLKHVERAFLRVDESLDQGDLMSVAPNNLIEALRTALGDDESVFAASSVMYGVSDDIEGTFDELFSDLVLRYEDHDERIRRDEVDIKREFDGLVSASGLKERVRFDYEITGANYSYQFHAMWRNGKPQVLEPISFDLVQGSGIVEKASHWSGRLYSLSKGADFAFTGLVAPPSDPTLGVAYERAVALLRGAPNVRQILTFDRGREVLDIIRNDTETPYSN